MSLPTQNQQPATFYLDHFSIGYGRRILVQDITCAIDSGELVMITGANGTGKSCLLRTLAGEQAPLAGSWKLPANFNPSDIAVVPQNTDNDIRLPIQLREVAALGTTGIRDPLLKEHLDDALDLVGLSGRQHQLWQASSGGERQRTLIARALVRQPKLLFLDEATSNIDQVGTQKLFASFAERCNNEKLTVFAVIHDDNLANNYASTRLHIANETVSIRSRPGTHTATR